MWLPAAGRPSESPTRAAHVASAVGGHITAAYWFTSLTSFANPAVTVARMFSDTFAGIAPSSAAMFLVMQLVRGALAYGLVRLLYPDAPAVAAEVAIGAEDRPTPRSRR